ncbi:hypothetical protein LTR66_004793 [Elasticomyces elasticus]|nr:hypothetical protein LTR66_004793 [Elasticomyces elasticus]
MFSEMRSALGIPKGEDILDYIYALPEKEQQEALDKIEAVERKAMKEQKPQAGLICLMEYLDKKRIRKGICTRNFNTPVTHLLTNHLPNHIDPFSPIVTRDFRPAKPSPAGILHIAEQWGLPNTQRELPAPTRPIDLIMVGDSIDDIIAGYEAGAATVLVRSEGKEDLERDARTDVVINRFVTYAHAYASRI